MRTVMKLRTTTPASLSNIAIIARNTLIMVIITVFAVTSFHFVSPVAADEYDDKIRALQADMARYQAESDRLNGEAASLANALAQITNEKNALQAQVDLSQSQYDKLVIDIADTEKKIKSNQDALGTTLANLYIDGQTTSIELLAGSDNISDFINKQSYRSSIRDQLSSTIQTVKDLKSKLDKQKVDVEKVLNEQKTARDSLVAKENEQANLLAQTRNDEATYQGLIASSATQIAAAKAAQAALAARANSSGGYSLVNSGSLGAYTSLWAPNDCQMGGPGGWYSYGGQDGNGGDGRGYGCRQCASYAAWKVASVTGKYYNWGNGGDFARNAIAAGYQDLGSSPQAGSIAVMWGNPGHVAWVEAVNGNQILVSQYNWQINGQYGMYSEMWLDKSVFDQYVKII
ncbi:MAG: CHAP domain-containing protein [Candidatus Microsaccharimonas sp.]